MSEQEAMSLRPEKRLGAELTGYRESDDGPRELRVDVVDRDELATLASLRPGAALDLAAELLSAVARARQER